MTLNLRISTHRVIQSRAAHGPGRAEIYKTWPGRAARSRPVCSSREYRETFSSFMSFITFEKYICIIWTIWPAKLPLKQKQAWNYEWLELFCQLKEFRILNSMWCLVLITAILIGKIRFAWLDLKVHLKTSILNIVLSIWLSSVRSIILVFFIILYLYNKFWIVFKSHEL